MTRRNNLISHLYPPEQQIPRRLDPESSEMHIGTSAVASHHWKQGGRQGEEGEARSNPSLPLGQLCSMVIHQWSFTKSKRPHFVRQLITPSPNALLLLVFLSSSQMHQSPPPPIQHLPALPRAWDQINNWSKGCCGSWQPGQWTEGGLALAPERGEMAIIALIAQIPQLCNWIRGRSPRQSLIPQLIPPHPCSVQWCNQMRGSSPFLLVYHSICTLGKQ